MCRDAHQEISLNAWRRPQIGVKANSTATPRVSSKKTVSAVGPETSAFQLVGISHKNFRLVRRRFTLTDLVFFRLRDIAQTSLIHARTIVECDLSSIRVPTSIGLTKHRVRNLQAERTETSAFHSASYLQDGIPAQSEAILDFFIMSSLIKVIKRKVAGRGERLGDETVPAITQRRARRNAAAIVGVWISERNENSRVERERSTREISSWKSSESGPKSEPK